MLKKTTSIKINPETWKKVKNHCTNKEIDISDWLEKLIIKELRLKK